MPIGEGIIGRAAASGQPVRSDDLRADARSAQRDVDEKEGMRSMLSVPLRVAGEIIGVISAFSTTPGFFTDRHPMLLEAFADQAGVAIQNARLFEESQRRARETQALLEAGRAVNQSLDVEETIRLILTQAREVLGVESCGLMTLDAATGELSSVASLDLDPASVARIRIRIGQGITGLAVQERRPVQSADLSHDPRAQYPQLHTEGALRSMLATPSSWAIRPSALSPCSGATSTASRRRRNRSPPPLPTRRRRRSSARACSARCGPTRSSSKRWWPRARARWTSRSGSWRSCWKRCPSGSSCSTGVPGGQRQP